MGGDIGCELLFVMHGGEGGIRTPGGLSKAGAALSFSHFVRHPARPDCLLTAALRRQALACSPVTTRAMAG